MKVAIDTGGTFTDIIVFDEKKTLLRCLKIPSTPACPEKAFLRGLEEILDPSGGNANGVQSIVHGTTLVTNALLQQQTAKIGLLVTAGFKDILEIGRQDRAELYNLQMERRPPLVSRELIQEIPERIGPEGQIIKELDEKAAHRALRFFRHEGVEALAISLLFSFLQPSHEEKLAQLACRLFPRKFVFLSSRLSPEFREYERTSTTAVAAAVAPNVVNYLKTVSSHLQRRGGSTPKFFIMHSGGGLLPANEAAHHPHQLIESGPAAGIMAAAHLSRLRQLPNIIAFDMGGTTAKAGLILNGEPQYTVDYQVGSEVHRGGRNIGGYPVRFPMIEVVECGAGSGSIAWMDPGGHLRVGPQSAGAYPGPASYGQGGKEPTVTDAYLVLGYLHPDDLLGGKKALYPELARKAIQEKIAQTLKIDLNQAAQGILTIVNANMLRILRLVSISKGHDPRDFTLLAYGGAGPLHACLLAEEMGVGKIIIPPLPGLFSAVGLFLSDITMDFVRTRVLLLSEKNIPHFRSLLSWLEAKARAWFQKVGFSPDRRALCPSADLRYQGQNYELNIPLVEKGFTSKQLTTLISSFHKAHQHTYGHCDPTASVELVNLRLRAILEVAKPSFPPLEKATASIHEVQESFRDIWLGGTLQERPSKIKCPVFDRRNLRAGHEIRGPALIKETSSTSFVGPGWHLVVDDLGHLIMSR